MIIGITVQLTWIGILIPSLISEITLSKLFNLPKTQFSYL